MTLAGREAFRPSPGSPSTGAGYTVALAAHDMAAAITPPTIPGADQMLAEAIKRAARQPHGRLAIVLHLSRMAPPAPRPHHRRIARSILQETAQRSEGQVFAMRNGDLVLLCKAGITREAYASTHRNPAPTVAEPAFVPDILGRLLRVDAPDPGALISVWPLATHLDQFTRYAQERLSDSDAVVPVADEPAASPSLVDAIGSLVTTGRIADLMQRQTAAVLVFPPGRVSQTSFQPISAATRDHLGQPPLHPQERAGQNDAEGRPQIAFNTGRAGSADPSDDHAGTAMLPALRPIYRELTFSIAAIEARLRAGGQASADPFLFRHLASRLDRRMLDLLRDELGQGGILDLAADHADDGAASPLHLNLTLAGIASASFARLAEACRSSGAQVAIEISFIEACADPDALAAARSAVRAAGMTLVLDGVSHLALLLARPTALRPDLMKLEWSPRLPDLREPDARHVRETIEAFGPHRLILQRAETEAALRWGLGHGIRKFQGRHVDAMLGAARILGCSRAAGCTLRQCIERASATGSAGRAGCGNPALLDSGAPPPGLLPLPRPPRAVARPDRDAALPWSGTVPA